MKIMIPPATFDFKELITNPQYYYVDKTSFIQELFELGDEVTLITRPRRFGKSLNISMLKYYFDIREDNKNLFKGLGIEKSDIFEQHLNKYPVIFLTFKDVKSDNWDECKSRFKAEIRREYREHKYLLESNKLDYVDKEYFKDIYEGKKEIDYALSIAEI